MKRTICKNCNPNRETIIGVETHCLECGIELIHILNEKTNNKPSFDTLSAFLLGYREIDPDWLIHGIGEPLRNMETKNTELWNTQINELNETPPQYGNEKKEVHPDTAELLKRIELLEIQMKKNEKEIELIKIKKRKE